MPKMRIKTTVAGWNNDTLSDNTKGFIRSFFNNATMYMYGVFNNDEYQHLSCAIQSKDVLRTSSDGTGDKLACAVCLPYKEGNIVGTGTSNFTVVGGNDCTIPDTENVLTSIVSQNLYLLNYRYDSDNNVTGSIECKLFVDNEVGITPYIGLNENKDANIKPSDITSEKPLRLTKVDNDGDSSEMKYTAHTDDFILVFKDGQSEFKNYRVFYNLNIVPFTIESEHNNMNYQKASEESDCNNIISSLNLFIGDDRGEVTGNSKQYMCYLQPKMITPDTAPYYKYRNNSDTIDFNSVFPLHLPNDTDHNQATYVRGLVCANLFMYNTSGKPIAFSYDSEKLKFGSLGDPASETDKTDTSIKDGITASYKTLTLAMYDSTFTME